MGREPSQHAESPHKPNAGDVDKQMKTSVEVKDRCLSYPFGCIFDRTVDLQCQVFNGFHVAFEQQKTGNRRAPGPCAKEFSNCRYCGVSATGLYPVAEFLESQAQWIEGVHKP